MNNLIQTTATPDQFKALRLKAGLTGEQTAKLLGLSESSGRQYINKLENGKTVITPQIWTLFLLATGEHPNFELEQKHKEFNMIIDTKSKQIDVEAAFIDAPFDINDNKIKCGINLSIKDKNFVCIVEKSDKFKLIDFSTEIKTYLSGFYDIRDFGDADDRHTQDYLDEAIDNDLSKIRQLVIDKAKEVINNYLESK